MILCKIKRFKSSKKHKDRVKPPHLQFVYFLKCFIEEEHDSGEIVVRWLKPNDLLAKEMFHFRIQSAVMLHVSIKLNILNKTF